MEHSIECREKGGFKKLKTKTTDMVIVEDKICTGCAEGDMQALRHKKSERRHETEVGALVYSDVFGPYPYPSLARHRYFVVFLDDASGYIATFFLRNVLSSALTEALNDYVTLLGKTQIRALRTDNTSYWKGHVRDFCRVRNIRQEFSPPYSHQSAGAAERAIGRVTQLCRKLVATTHTPCEFWPYAIRMAALILNKTGNSPISTKSPFEVFFRVKPSISDIKVFGCLAKKSTPLPVTDTHPELDTSPLLRLEDHRKLQMLLGMLQWLVTICRPDLACLVASLNRFGA